MKPDSLIAASAAVAVTLLAGIASASDLNVPPCMETGREPVDADSATFVFVGEGGGGLTTEASIAAVVAGAEQWNAVSCTSLTVEAGPAVERLEQVPEGAIPIFFAELDDPCFPMRPDQDPPIGFTISCPDYPSPSILLNNITYEWSDEPMPFQSVDSPDARPVVDARSVITHEMGHALSLPHNDDPISTMFARYRRDGSQATLSAADDLALCAIYRGGENECGDDSDCSEGACLVDGANAACDSFRGETGAFCSWEVLQCSERCFFSSPDTGTGYCSESCSADDDCPDRMVCSATSTGDSLCQFEFGEAETASCAAAGSSSPLTALALLLVILGRRRRT